jgi:hypothetical protein
MKRFILLLLIATINVAYAEQRSSLSQFGITWTFDKEYEVGQFCTGDWWVVGPVVVQSVSPGPGPAGADETARTDYVRNFINQFGDTDLQDNTVMRNGSMVNPSWGSGQGYDSGCMSYNGALSVAFPLTLGTNQSLVSTISNKTLPNPLLLPFYNEASRSVLKTAAILTCLASAPPADAFRPPYAASWKPIYRAGNLKREILPNLTAPPVTPTLAEMKRLVERPWLDHVNNWMGGTTAPVENMATYGREFGRMVSLVGLRLMVAGTPAEKESLLIKFVQLGIDLHGLRRDGAKWQMGGGITSGRKWPVVFAGVLLGDEDMQTFAGASEFHEDQQTYYGTGWTGATALWQMVLHHGLAPLYEHKNPATWSDMDRQSHGYRLCCNSLAWIGQQVGALLIGAKKVWNHDAFFDYCDRYMTEQAVVYNGTGVSTDLMGRAFDNFVNFMYVYYRKSLPVQEGAANNMKWEPLDQKWVPDLNAPVIGIGDEHLPPVNSRAEIERLDPNPMRDRVGFICRNAAGYDFALTVYDSAGKVIYRNQVKPDGAADLRLEWDGAGPDGQPVEPGMYFYHLQSGVRISAGKIIKIE